MDKLAIHDADLKEKVDKFREDITTEAEHLIADFFPRKCIELDALLKEDFLQLEKTTSVKGPINLPVPDPIVLNHNDSDNQNGPSSSKKRKLATTVNEHGEAGESGTKVFIFPNGVVPCNEKVLKIVDLLKPEVRTLIEKCNTVRMWVTLLIPKIEDGNNFGVSIQEETLSELRQVEGESASFLDQISKYFFTRGQIIAKAAKYPHIGDYRQFIGELDEKQFLSLRLIASELRNHYSVLHDMIIKNIEKIKKPRNVNIDGMY
ncbi:proteasome activator complex subunit 3-like [Clavelina lepadiformis]|uniref:proteasome activator complex subunit 3-like n=1 Tax=Clavelina lepadiformis TaxID=159417 RepID=UPI004043897D